MSQEYNNKLIEKLDAYLSSGISQNKAADEIGMSASTLSQYRKGIYGGNIEAVESKLRESLRIQKQQRSSAVQLNILIQEFQKVYIILSGFVICMEVLQQKQETLVSVRQWLQKNI